jgi:hypothetical protein
MKKRTNPLNRLEFDENLSHHKPPYPTTETVRQARFGEKMNSAQARFNPHALALRAQFRVGRYRLKCGSESDEELAWTTKYRLITMFRKALERISASQSGPETALLTVRICQNGN